MRKRKGLGFNPAENKALRGGLQPLKPSFSIWILGGRGSNHRVSPRLQPLKFRFRNFHAHDNVRSFVGRGFSHDISPTLTAASAAEVPLSRFPRRRKTLSQGFFCVINLV
jgi:hypothetical protein